MIEIKTKLHEQALKEFMHRVDYRVKDTVNESPNYRPLVGVDEEFDELPKTNEAGEQEDAPKPAGGAVPPAPSNDQPMGGAPAAPAEAPVPPDIPSPDIAPEGGMPPAGGAPEGGMPVVPTAEPIPAVDDVQNEIIKSNIEAMKAIHDQLEMLSSMSQALDAKLNVLTTDVEEVREPTNVQKLMSKTNVSYPYYFNLNDYWEGNWFNQQKEGEVSKGIKEMPDGTFVADFDDLPQQSKTDVQNSFNDI